MTTDVSTALADPAAAIRTTAQALKALDGRPPGQRRRHRGDALSKALADARRWHRERGDFELCLQLIDLELGVDHRRRPPRRSAAREGARCCPTSCCATRRVRRPCSEALEAAPDHGPSTESLAQMTLVRANWEPISKRYLQQAEAGQGSGAGLQPLRLGRRVPSQVPRRPAPRGRRICARAWSSTPHNRRSGGAPRTRAARDGPARRAAGALRRRAERAPNREERAAGRGPAGELCEQAGARRSRRSTHFRKALDANPDEPRALRAVRAALTRQQEPGPSWPRCWRRAARTKRGEQDVALLIELATLIWQAARPAGHGGVVLPPRAQARSRPTTRWSSSIATYHTRAERAAAAAGGAGAGAEDRGGPGAARRDGDRDGARRRAAAAARREGHRASGRGCCACGRTCPRR